MAAWQRAMPFPDRKGSIAPAGSKGALPKIVALDKGWYHPVRLASRAKGDTGC